jgi:uncharacterized protein DUF1579
VSEASIFADDVGTWDADVIVRPAPGAPEQRSKGVSVERLVGGWLIADFKNETGFEGHGIFGWDAARKAYVGTWVDPMRPFLIVMQGSWDEAARTLRFDAEATLPDGRALRWREATERPDADTRVFRQWFGDHEMMTVTYRRRAGA